MYLTYAEYLELNGRLSNEQFHSVINKVVAKVDTATHNRIHGMSEVPKKVKMLCKELVDCLINHERNVTSRSQSAGGVSESESYAVETSETDTDRLIQDFLLWETDDKGIPLLSRSAL